MQFRGKRTLFKRLVAFLIKTRDTEVSIIIIITIIIIIILIIFLIIRFFIKYFYYYLEYSM